MNGIKDKKWYRVLELHYQQKFGEYVNVAYVLPSGLGDDNKPLGDLAGGIEDLSRAQLKSAAFDDTPKQSEFEKLLAHSEDVLDKM